MREARARVDRVRFVAGHLPARRAAAVLLVAAVAMTGAGSIGAAIGARRAQRSVPDFLRYARLEQAGVLAQVPPQQGAAVLGRVRSLPGVVAVRRFALLVVGLPVPGARHLAPLVGEADIDPLTTHSALDRPFVVAGRTPDPTQVGEIAVNEAVASRLHLHVGDRLPVGLYGTAQLDAVGSGSIVEPSRGRRTFTVVGILRRPADLEAVGTNPTEANVLEDGYVWTTPAFWREEGPKLAAYGVVSYAGIHGSVAAVARAATSAHLPVVVIPGTQALHDPASLRRATHVESAALWAAALLVALVALALVGPALRRWAGIGEQDEPTLVAVGCTRRDLLATELLRALPLLLAGTALAVPLGAALGPHAAFGTSRLAERTHPVTWPPGILVGGAGLIVGLGLIVVLAPRLVPSLRPSAADRASLGDLGGGSRRLLAQVTAAGAPPAVVAGARLALPSGGRDGAGIRSAVVTVALGVALLVGALTFGSSMRHLVDTPRLRGWNWDEEVANASQASTQRAAARLLRTDPDVEAFTGENSGNLAVGGRPLGAVGLEDVGMARLPVFSGRLPARSGEVALTPHTLRELHRHVGDTIRIEGDHTETFRIVGTTVGPGSISDELQLDHGATMTFADLHRLQGDLIAGTFLVRFRPGVDHDAARARLLARFPGSLVGPFATPEITALERIERLPLVLAGLVATIAVGTLVYAVGTALRRRRREVAVLKAIGFGRGQLRTATLVQAVSLVVVALLVGVPLGIVAGRATWGVAARTVGVVVAPAVPVAPLALVALGALLLAVVLGAVAGRGVAGVSAAETLRPE